MVSEHPPDGFCPSMKPETIAFFIHFKCQPAGTPLEDMDSTPILDVFGEQVLCQGGWKHRGCRFHHGKLLLWHTGNPKHCEFIRNTLKQNSNDGVGYIAGGDSPLTPWELLDIRELCIKNTIGYLQFWVMTLLACKLFLHEEEVASLKMDSICWDLCVISPTGEIEGLAVQIQGKSDSVPVTHMIWADLNSVQSAILLHIFTLEISRLDTCSPRSRICSREVGQTRSHMLSNQSWYKKICHLVIEKTHDGLFGSHTNRKAMYLLAVWGGGDDADIFRSAHHKTISNATKYKCDTKFLPRRIKSCPKLSACKSVFCEDIQLAWSINI